MPAPVRRSSQQPAHASPHGYSGTKIPAVAVDAGVDPALVHYIFATKGGLFTAVMTLPFRPRRDP
jgi:AcrR family transcriptional regulator